MFGIQGDFANAVEEDRVEGIQVLAAGVFLRDHVGVRADVRVPETGLLAEPVYRCEGSRNGVVLSAKTNVRPCEYLLARRLLVSTALAAVLGVQECGQDNDNYTDNHESLHS